MRRRVVVVPYFYPPFPGSGNRWPAMVRYLRRAGHSVTVIATDVFGRLPDDEDMSIVRVNDLRSALPLRRLFRRGNSFADTVGAPPSALLTKILVPDANVVGWLPAALLAVRRILANDDVDCLVTSGPPDSNHLLGLALGARRPAWVADFRDGWCFEPLREPFPTAPQRALDRWLERRVARRADVVVGATRPIADDLERRLGARAVHVSNGWDPEVALAAPPPSTGSAEVVTFVYTGTLSGIRGSDPEPLFRALKKVRDEPGAPPVRLLHAGVTTEHERRLIHRSDVADSVEHVGLLDRAEAVALQRTADALVLLTSRNTSEATGKLFEYLGAGRPIVALAKNNEAERIVRETNTGVAVPPDDVDAIADALRRVISGELTAAYSPRNLERFTYPGPAKAMEEVIERAIWQRSSSRAARNGV
jgi:glycosyltransferase involved in cell wall biosynthesis